MATDPNRQILQLVAKALGELREQVVFVGGCAASLLITVERAQMIRPTDDVDMVVKIASIVDYHAIEAQLSDKGFKRSQAEGAPICRWTYQGIDVDVMPTDQSILGFTNRWYDLAVESSQQFQLENNISINLIIAPLFIATKLEAYLGRGNGDIVMSHDLEDIANVIDGRPEVLDEIKQANEAVKNYIALQFKALLSDNAFKVALSGFLPPDHASQARLPALITKITVLAKN